ncbi:TRAF-like, SKP1/BTB/POZ domain, BTB/Kelch-associated [Artemisia annua]|uniref:TRAF-like, SKP1/BTB/POZ domain, BTB/Kelch-associated n=1 Tax=Artemisia annua TaxID=35608 RepID=A0A2U1KGM5_ARTAN|nr:TRAF-like, SKP1/BTB/POZ domain, BTB/Kelch-associated [Artemisia annua]
MHNSNHNQDTIPSPEHSHGGFAFALNDSNFSDRILRIEIVTEPLDCRDDGGGGDGCTSLADWARNRKRRRDDFKKDNQIFEEIVSYQPRIRVCLVKGYRQGRSQNIL